MHKYQFYISYNEKRNTAASKAIQDCRSILAALGYEDLTIESELNANKSYLTGVLANTIKFYLKLKPRSIVAVQYPLLSGNFHFKYFIKIARLKRISFFCIIHDIEELRYASAGKYQESKEIKILNSYDCVIVHNDVMQNWLIQKGLKVPVINLKVFDYLTIKDIRPVLNMNNSVSIRTIIFAGNLAKSNFIYDLSAVSKWQFSLYGPNFITEKSSLSGNVKWNGSLGPDEIARQLKGDFGLIWDGDSIDLLTGDNGTYLRYNNPHKLSLYLAAGIPVIAPKESAISGFVKKHKIGFLIDSLLDLNSMEIDSALYEIYKRNAILLSNNIKNGFYLETAVKAAEKEIMAVNELSGALA